MITPDLCCIINGMILRATSHAPFKFISIMLSHSSSVNLCIAIGAIPALLNKMSIPLNSSRAAVTQLTMSSSFLRLLYE